MAMMPTMLSQGQIAAAAGRIPDDILWKALPKDKSAYETSVV